MNLLAYAQTMAAYNRWMNARLYECCARLSDEERKRDAGAFFKSIHGTLNHLLLGDRIWLGRFVGKPFVVQSLDQELYADFGELRAERVKTDAAIDEWLSSLSESDFEADLSYTSVVNPQPRRYPLWFAVTHFFNHQTHHRGQLTTLLSQRGMDPGVTDLIWLPEWQRMTQWKD
ncbi:MAG: DinB family protein [Burkholderiales bacterium]